MDDSASASKAGGVAGIVFVVLTVASIFIVKAPPATDAGAQAIKDYLLDVRSSAMASLVLTGLALPLLLLFLNGLRHRLASGTRDAWLGEFGARCGVLFALGIVVANAAFYASVWTKLTTAAPATTFRATWDFGYVLYLVLFPTAAAFLLAVGLGIVRGRALPSWLGWFAVAIGVLMVLATVALLSPSASGPGIGVYLLFQLWVLITGITMVRSPGDAAATTA